MDWIVIDCSVLFFSRPQAEGLPHHEHTFSIYLCQSSAILIIHYNAVIVTENHLCFVTGRHILANI